MRAGAGNRAAVGCEREQARALREGPRTVSPSEKMGKRRRVHSAIDDDDAIHIDVQHSRQMKLGASKRYIIRTPRSPKKKPAVTAPSTAPSISSWAPNEEMEHWDVDAIEDLLEHDIDTVKMHKKRSAASVSFGNT